MFLRSLSDHDYEEEYWPFVFRLETVLAGILKEGGERLAEMNPDDAYMFLFDSLGNALDPQNGLLPPNWWPEPIPSIEWFDDYLRREVDFIVAEAKKRAAAKSPSAADGKDSDGGTDKSSDDAASDFEKAVDTAAKIFDKRKVRDYAHRSETFRRFILPYADPDDSDAGANHHHGDQPAQNG